MTLQVIGAGLGRTGTYSLRSALNALGLGPCFHMEEVMHHMPVQLPLWQAAVSGAPDWGAIYGGYHSAVDWPTASFYAELQAAYPDAKFVLTTRSPESWAASFSETIYKLISARDQAPPHMLPWLEMSIAAIGKAGVGLGLGEEGLAAAFVAHEHAVREAIPARSLLVYEVAQGWEPLCAFLDVPVPTEDFPRTNSRAEFWELVRKGSEVA